MEKLNVRLLRIEINVFTPQYYISRDANSTVWTPTTQKFSLKFAKKSSDKKRRKIREERDKKSKNSPF
jgi:hypothetical protein